MWVAFPKAAQTINRRMKVLLLLVAFTLAGNSSTLLLPLLQSFIDIRTRFFVFPTQTGALQLSREPVGLQHPFRTAEIATTVEISNDQILSSSSVIQSFFVLPEQDGQSYCNNSLLNILLFYRFMGRYFVLLPGFSFINHANITKSIYKEYLGSIILNRKNP